MEKTARLIANAHYTVNFFNTKGKKHIFEILSIYSFDGYLAVFPMYPLATPNRRSLFDVENRRSHLISVYKDVNDVYANDKEICDRLKNLNPNLFCQFKAAISHEE